MDGRGEECEVILQELHFLFTTEDRERLSVWLDQRWRSPHWRAEAEKRWSNDTIATRKGDTSAHGLHSRALMHYTGATQKAYMPPQGLWVWHYRASSSHCKEGRLIKWQHLGQLKVGSIMGSSWGNHGGGNLQHEFHLETLPSYQAFKHHMHTISLRSCFVVLYVTAVNRCCVLDAILDRSVK